MRNIILNKEVVSFLFYISLFFLMIGCAGLNEGAIDYRYVPSSDGANVAELKDSKYLTKKEVKAGIIKNDSISVHLQQAYLKEFSERFEHYYRFDGNIRGEIVIVAKVYELGKGKNIEHNYSSVKSGRVVYYCEDVRAGGQPLNLSSLLVYGPIRYDGNPLVIELFILELDAEETQRFKGLLKALTQVGSVAYPPASPALKILDSIGGAFLIGNQDDVEFRYQFVLYPNMGDNFIRQARIAAGDYVFIKESEDRNAEIEWNNLKLHRNTGRLVYKTGNKEYREKTYLVIQINTGFDSLKLDVAQLYSEFTQQNQLATEEDIKQFLDNIDRLSLTVQQYVTLNELKNKIRKFDNLDDTEKKNLLSTIIEAVKKEHDSVKQVLPSEQIDYIIVKLKEKIPDKDKHKYLRREEIRSSDPDSLKNKLGL